MHEHLAAFEATGRSEEVLFVRRAQEKTALFRTERRRDAEGKAYPRIVKAAGLVNHFYLYAVDADFGPFFVKFCSYFPYNAKLRRNGHEWAKRQAGKAGIGFTALDCETSPPSTTSPRCRPSAIASARRGSTRCSASGWCGCPTATATR